MGHKRYQGHLRSRTVMAFRQLMKEEFIECHEEGCSNRATIPDHVPPVSSFADPRDWHGELKPHCRSCSNRQAGFVRHKKIVPSASREW